jgi:hypothetical protein
MGLAVWSYGVQDRFRRFEASPDWSALGAWAQVQRLRS